MDLIVFDILVHCGQEQHADDVAMICRPPMPKTWPKPLRSLFSDMWNQNYSERPSMAQVVERLKDIQGVFSSPDACNDSLQAVVAYSRFVAAGLILHCLCTVLVNYLEATGQCPQFHGIKPGVRLVRKAGKKTGWEKMKAFFKM